MTYVTSIERLGIEKGLQQGMQQERRYLIQRQLTRRCGALPAEIIAQLEQLTMAQLEQLADALLDFTGPDDLQAWLQTTR